MSNAPAAGKGDKNAPDLSMIGPYKLVSCVSSGKNSQVWEAMSADGQRRLAVKMLSGEALKDSEQLASIKNEFTIGKQLDHPNIIKYFDGHWGTMFKKDGYFSMELFMAPNLKVQMFNNLNSVQVRFRKIFESAAMALQHIHDKGFINRDIKPDNILVSRSAELKVIDMSLATRPAGALAKVFGGKSKTSKGTRSYMAPEQIMRKPLSFQVDMYAFGITVFEMLTGQAPFTGTTPNDLLMRHIQDPAPPPSMFNTNVTEEMDRLVLRLLSKKADQRHKTFNEVLAEFRRINPWKEEVVTTKELTEEEKAQQDIGQNLGERLDSRTDAMRTSLGIAAPPKPKKATPAPPKPEPAKSSKPAAAPAAQRPPAPQPPQMMPQPMMPQPMFPGQFPMPGQMMPGQFGMPGMMPGAFPPMPAAGQPMMPPGGRMPVPGVPPSVAGQMPGQQISGQPPYPMAPQPGGVVTPWVAAPGKPAGAQGVAPPAVPGAAVPRPIVPAPAAQSGPAGQRPAVPPVNLAPGQRPAAPSPAAPTAKVPVQNPVPQPAKKPAPPPASPGGGMRIDDLMGFDDLPSA